MVPLSTAPIKGTVEDEEVPKGTEKNLEENQRPTVFRKLVLNESGLECTSSDAWCSAFLLL